MRLTYLLDSPNCGGAEIYLALLAERVAADVTVVATEPVCGRLADAARRAGRLVLVDAAGRPHRAGSASGPGLPPADVASLAAVVRGTGPDLVHVNAVDPSSNVALQEAAAEAGCPTVVTVHMTGDLARDVRADLLRAYDGAQVIAVSGQIHRLLVDDLGLPADRVHQVRNGVPPLALARRDQGRRVVIGGVGRLTPQKGFDLLLEAVGRLGAAGDCVRVRIAGEGRDRQAPAAAARDLPVDLVGHLDDIATFLAGVDVFCLPSRAEGLPLALLEAMSAGLPCVASAVGAIPEAVGDAAVLVAPGDVDALTAALAGLVAAPGRRRDLGARAALLARRRFHVDRMVADTVAVYERALRPGPATPSVPA